MSVPHRRSGPERIPEVLATTSLEVFDRHSLLLNPGVVAKVEDAVAVYTSELDYDEFEKNDCDILLQDRLKKGCERLDNALEEIALEPDEAFRLISKVMAYHAQGNTAESDAALAEVIENHGSEWASNIASVLAYRGEIDRSFEWLEKAVECHDPGLIEIATQPEFSNLHTDPRWSAFLARMGRSPEQLAAIDFEVALPS